MVFIYAIGLIVIRVYVCEILILFNNVCGLLLFFCIFTLFYICILHLFIFLNSHG